MDNSIMIYPISNPSEYRRQCHLITKNIHEIYRFLQGNRNEHSTYNCEDVVPARQSAENLLQIFCEIHEEICAMQKIIEDKHEYNQWKAEVGYFEKEDARD